VKHSNYFCCNKEFLLKMVDAFDNKKIFTEV
jgi:hypothetical protein